MDADLDALSPQQLIAEVKRLRAAIRQHRDSTGHDLCWHHPDLWSLLPEKKDPVVTVPAWPQFLRGCIRYRQSLDAQAPGAPRVCAEFTPDGGAGQSVGGHPKMNETDILEVAVLPILAGHGAEFEAAFEIASGIISASPGYVSHELRRCLEVNDRYILLVRWCTLEDHTVGFRESSAYQGWKNLLHRFYNPFPVVEHYAAVQGGGV